MKKEKIEREILIFFVYMPSVWRYILPNFLQAVTISREEQREIVKDVSH